MPAHLLPRLCQLLLELPAAPACLCQLLALLVELHSLLQRQQLRSSKVLAGGSQLRCCQGCLREVACA
jgi:hypothetical protein